MKAKKKAPLPHAETQRVMRNTYTLLCSGAFGGSQAAALAEAQALFANLINQMDAADVKAAETKAAD